MDGKITGATKETMWKRDEKDLFRHTTPDRRKTLVLFPEAKAELAKMVLADGGGGMGVAELLGEVEEIGKVVLLVCFPSKRA